MRNACIKLDIISGFLNYKITVFESDRDRAIELHKIWLIIR